MKGREFRGTTLVYQSLTRLNFRRIATNCCNGRSRVESTIAPRPSSNKSLLLLLSFRSSLSSPIDYTLLFNAIKIFVRLLFQLKVHRSMLRGRSLAKRRLIFQYFLAVSTLKQSVQHRLKNCHSRRMFYKMPESF